MCVRCHIAILYVSLCVYYVYVKMYIESSHWLACVCVLATHSFLSNLSLFSIPSNCLLPPASKIHSSTNTRHYFSSSFPFLWSCTCVSSCLLVWRDKTHKKKQMRLLVWMVAFPLRVPHSSFRLHTFYMEIFCKTGRLALNACNILV